MLKNILILGLGLAVLIAAWCMATPSRCAACESRRQRWLSWLRDRLAGRQEQEPLFVGD